MKVTLTLEHDDINPLEDEDGNWTLYSFNRRHGNFKHPEALGLGPLDAYGDPVITNIGLRRKLDVGLAFIVSCYQHSGIQWGLKGEVHQCPWDTAQIAGLLVWEHKPKDMGAKTYEDRQEDARAFLKDYTHVCNGQVYYYRLEDEEGNEIDSCGGYLHPDAMFEEIRHSLPQGAEVTVQGDASYLADNYDLTPLAVNNG